MDNCPYPVITVRWADHWEEDGEFSLEDIKKNLKPYYGHFSGHLIAESKQMVAMCANVWEDGEGGWSYTDPFFIMKKSITSRSDKDKLKES